MEQSRMKRRTFVKAAATAVAAPVVITTSALGDDTTPPASERVTVGHIGVGGRGRAVFRGIQQSKDAQSVAISDCYKSRRESMAASIGGKAYQDFRDLLAQDDIDCVVIATPDHWHVPIAIAAARAKKGAYVEKPLGVSIEQDLACQKVFEENDQIFQYGTQQRSMRHCWQCCELVRRGAIGKVTRIEVIAPNGHGGGTTEVSEVPEDLDYKMWCGPSPVRPYTRDRCKPPGTYMIYDYSIGYLGGWGAHPLDIMVWGSDADISGIVTCEGTGTISPGLLDTVHSWNMNLMLGDVEMKFTHGRDLTTFYGEDGKWVRAGRGSGIQASDPKILETPLDGEPILQVSKHHQDNFIQSVKNHTPAVSPIDDSVRSDIISLLCDIAVRTGRKITWDPAKKTIVGDDEAIAMMKRPMEAPWTL